jgi:hypothetical protein
MTQAQLKRIKAKRRREAELKRRMELKDAEFNLKCGIGFVVTFILGMTFLLQWDDIAPFWAFAVCVSVSSLLWVGIVALLDKKWRIYE